MTLSKDAIFNIADCATRRGINAWLVGNDRQRAHGEFDTAESMQRRHSYTWRDTPFYGAGIDRAMPAINSQEVA
jgi:hypothetical protein